MYIENVERDNMTTFDTASKLEIYKQVFLNVEGHQSDFLDYRLIRT